MSSDTEKFVIKVENRNAVGNPLYYENFLALFRNCPRQDNPTNDVIGPYGYEVFVHSEQPTVGQYEKAVLGPYIFQNNVWTNSWTTVPMTPEEIQVKQDYQWKVVRSTRNRFLRKSDWTQLADVTMSPSDLQLWRTYRQQLRDITNVYTDPFDVVFPDPPYPFEYDIIPGVVVV